MDANGATARLGTMAGPGAWFAAAGGLAIMAALGFSALGAIEELRSAPSPVDAVAEAGARYGWVVLALYGIALLDIVVAWGLWRVLRIEQPGGAALAAAFRLAYAAVFVGAIAQLDHAVRIGVGADAATAGLTERDALVREQVQGFDAAWNGGLLVFGAHLAVVGWLLIRRRGVVVTAIGALVLVSGLGYAADTVIRLLAPRLDAGVAVFTFIGEILLIGWLVAGGIRSARGPGGRLDDPTGPSRPTARALAAEGA